MAAQRKTRAGRPRLVGVGQLFGWAAAACDGIDQSLDRIDQCLDRIDQSLDRIDQCLDRIDQCLDRVDQCLDRVDQCLGRSDQRIDQCLDRIDQCAMAAASCLAEGAGTRRSETRRGEAADGCSGGASHNGLRGTSLLERLTFGMTAREKTAARRSQPC